MLALALVFIALFCAYQQYLIYTLDLKVTSLLNSREESVINRPNTVSVISPISKVDSSLSPPPIIPKWSGNSVQNKTGIYGGAGDEIHLGGFIDRDNKTININFWNYLLGPLAARSVLDIGCGRGE